MGYAALLTDIDFTADMLQNHLAKAEAGDVTAQYVVAQCYREGKGGAEKDYNQAYLWHKRAADQGYIMSKRRLGYYCLMGWGTNRDESQAIQYYREAAEAGELTSAFNLAVLYESGCSVCAKNVAEAKQWYMTAAQAGHSASMNNLALLLLKENASSAWPWFIKAASMGRAQSQFNLYLYSSSRSSRSAQKWLMNSADNGDAAAKELLKRRKKT